MKGKEIADKVHKELIEGFWPDYTFHVHPGYFPINFVPLACSTGGIRIVNERPFIVIDDSFENITEKQESDWITLKYTSAHETAHGLLIAARFKLNRNLPSREVAETLGTLTALHYFKIDRTAGLYEREVNKEGKLGLEIYKNHDISKVRKLFPQIIRLEDITIDGINKILSAPFF